MTGLAWSLEWRLALRRRRTFALNVGVPLLLVTPIALSGAPPAHAAAVYTVLFTFFATFGSAIPLVRDAENGILLRIACTGIPARRFFLGRTIAHTAIDGLQLLPALFVIIAASPRPAEAASLPILLALTLLAANALGTCIAAAARSIAEAALLAAVAALFALHFAGVFRTPAPGSAADWFQLAIPFHYLHQGLRSATGAAMLGPVAPILASMLTALALFAVVIALAPSILDRVAYSRSP